MITAGEEGPVDVASLLVSPSPFSGVDGMTETSSGFVGSLLSPISIDTRSSTPVFSTPFLTFPSMKIPVACSANGFSALFMCYFGQFLADLWSFCFGVVQTA